MGTNAAFAQATVVGLTNVLFTVVAMVLIDRLGRKPLLIAGLTGIIVSMSLVSYGFGQATYTLTETSVSALEIDAARLPLGALSVGQLQAGARNAVMHTAVLPARKATQEHDVACGTPDHDRSA